MKHDKTIRGDQASLSKRKNEDDDSLESRTVPKRDSKKAKKSSRDDDSTDAKKSKKDRKSSSQSAAVEDTKETTSSLSRKERKKRSKKRTAASDTDTSEDESEDEASDEDVPMKDADEEEEEQPVEAEVTKSEEKKERRKKKKKAEEEAEETPDKLDKRYQSVLVRKAKSLKLAGEAALPKDEAEDAEPEEPQEVHDLGPLPQPKLVSEDAPKPTYETLPDWLAAPIRVSQDTRTPFSELGLLPRAAKTLADKGFPDAFAVQTAAIPLLLPTSKQPGDLLISAATGSGKTLAYALPVVRDISGGLATRLRALVVLPTRELVRQAQEVFDLCARAYEGGDRKRVRIGVSIGSQSLKSEQEHLVERHTRYDPDAYEAIVRERRERRADPTASTDFDSLLGSGLDEADPRLGQWHGDVVDFSSKVDVLICTPGRLVEHMEQTPGFDLSYVRWLVVDEADKLLAQSFQGWLDMTMEKLGEKTSTKAGGSSKNRTVAQATARQFPDMDFEGVRKVILSATLTRDLSLLNQLALRRPRLIVLEGSTNAGSQDEQQAVAEHSLPDLLTEHAIRVHNTNLKPMYLLHLLKDGHMETREIAAAKPEEDAASDTSSDDSSSDSDSDSDTSSDSDSSSDSEETPANTKIPVSLIFTKSNESALRLSRLLALLDPSLASAIATLTSTTPTGVRRKTLRAFARPSSSVRLIVASDLVARGIDIPSLRHVINYDLPASAAGYVHRVGRTARAGRAGQAWTLVGDDESGWFWGRIGKAAGIRRAQKVDRVRIDEMAEDEVESYEGALEKLGQEATETRGRR